MSIMKVALVGYRLNKGGAEKVMATLSNYFYQNGINVHLIIVLDDIKYPHSGTVVNLGKLKNKTNGIFNKFKRLLYLSKYLKAEKFDFIIDIRFRVKPLQELFISKWLYNAKTIYTIHSSKTHIYLPKFKPLAKLIYGNCFRIISISKAMENMIRDKHNLNNVTTIYNPIDIEYIRDKAKEEIDLDFEYIISAGHFNTDQKQFDKLIYAYSRSILPKKNIALVILGDGKDKDYLIDVATSNGVIDFVHFLGFKNNPYKYFSKAKYFAMSSLHEGMPMVLIEALACGTPLVSFDCPTGPNEIIKNRENGILVENQNIEDFIDSLNLFISDSDLYVRCKEETLSSVNKFSVNEVGKQWFELMNFIKN